MLHSFLFTRVRSLACMGLLGATLALAGCSGDGTVSEVNNGGGGGGGGLTLNFGNATSFTLDGGNGGSANPQIVTVGFFNNDLFLDYAVANNGTNNVSVFLGNGDGTFQAEQLFDTAASFPTAIAAANFDGDGDVDLAVATSSEVSILINDGTGAFPTRNDIAAGTSNRGIAVDDFDNVNGFDIAVSDSGNDTVNVLINDGAGNFNVVNFASAGNLSNIRAVVAGDFNGDAFPDLAVANFGDNFGTVWINSGNAADLFPDGNANSNLPMPVGATAQAIAEGDLTGDGIDDVAIPSIDGNNSVLRTFVNDGNGVFTIGNTEPISQDPFGAEMADFNQDNRLDVLAGSAFGLNLVGTGEADILPGNGDGTVQPQVPFSVSANEQVRSVAVGDFNGDGLPDIVTAAGGTANVLLNTSN